MIKGRAIIVSGTIAGRGAQLGVVKARAAARGLIDGGAYPALAPLVGDGDITRGTGLFHWLNVTPTEPQQLVWLIPQYGIDYTVETSTNLKWQIK